MCGDGRLYVESTLDKFRQELVTSFAYRKKLTGIDWRTGMECRKGPCGPAGANGAVVEKSKVYSVRREVTRVVYLLYVASLPY